MERTENRLTDPGDRNLFRALVLETLRHRLRLDNLLDGLLTRGNIRDLPVPIRWILRIGAAQLVLLPWIPPYAAVNSMVDLAGAFGHKGTSGLVNAILRKIARDTQSMWEDAGRVQDPEDGTDVDPAETLALAYSHPLWLVQRWVERWGVSRTETVLAWGNELPDYWVRRNLFYAPGTQGDSWPPAGAAEGWIPNTARFPAGSKPAEHAGFLSGAWTIQDGSGILVTRIVPWVRGVVIDVCAAPGTKTGALLEIAEPDTKVIALDLSAGRLRRAAAGLSRIGWRTCEPIPSGGARASLFIAAADGRALPVRACWTAALVDAPCSNLGVIRRRPDLKWRCSEKEIIRLSRMQWELLCSAAAGVVPGGWLVYSVCTVEPEETTEQRDRFFAEHPDWRPGSLPSLIPDGAKLRAGEMMLLPGECETDGTYAFIALAPGTDLSHG